MCGVSLFGFDIEYQDSNCLVSCDREIGNASDGRIAIRLLQQAHHVAPKTCLVGALRSCPNARDAASSDT